MAEEATGRHRRPLLPGELPDLPSDAVPDHASATEHAGIAAETTARALLDQARSDPRDVDRLLRLADDVGLEELAALWARAETGTLPAALWALFVLQTWCRRAPLEVARLVAAGRPHAEVSASIAGLPDETSREDVLRLADDILRGALARDLPTSLERAAALCRVLAAGRGAVPSGAREDPWAQPVLGARLLTTAEGLDRAARTERSGHVES